LGTTRPFPSGREDEDDDDRKRGTRNENNIT
jgi:hypothetical protein